METYTLLTRSDLAKRWKVVPVTIDRWVDAGVISPVKGIPSIRFSMDHILKLEGVEISKLSPFERKRLEKEVNDLKENLIQAEEVNKKLKHYVKTVIQQGFQLVEI